MRLQTIVLTLVVIVAGAFVHVALRQRNTSRRALAEFWGRQCNGKAWLQAFPTASADDIRRFLNLFVEAFAFPRNRALKFSPSDRVMAVYRSLYPDRGWPDALELETFATSVERTYSLRMSEVWREDITLGDIFSRTRQTPVK
jgi:hypothetical protein